MFKFLFHTFSRWTEEIALVIKSVFKYFFVELLNVIKYEWNTVCFKLHLLSTYTNHVNILHEGLDINWNKHTLGLKEAYS